MCVQSLTKHSSVISRYVNFYRNAFTYRNMQTYRRVYKHIYRHVYIQLYIYIKFFIARLFDDPAYSHILVQLCTRLCIHLRTHTYIHMLRRVYIYIHIYTTCQINIVFLVILGVYHNLLRYSTVWLLILMTVN